MCMSPPFLVTSLCLLSSTSPVDLFFVILYSVLHSASLCTNVRCTIDLDLSSLSLRRVSIACAFEIVIVDGGTVSINTICVPTSYRSCCRCFCRAAAITDVDDDDGKLSSSYVISYDHQ